MALQIVEIESDRVVAQLEKIGPNVHDALVKAIGPLAAAIGASARARAAAHIRFEGKKNPGSYLASIKDGVAEKEDRVLGYVRSGHPLAHLLEYGADPGPHEILPSAASILHFMSGADEVFAKKVNHPGAHIPPYPAIEPAFESARPEIRRTIESAVKNAARERR